MKFWLKFKTVFVKAKQFIFIAPVKHSNSKANLKLQFISSI